MQQTAGKFIFNPTAGKFIFTCLRLASVVWSVLPSGSAQAADLCCSCIDSNVGLCDSRKSVLLVFTGLVFVMIFVTDRNASIAVTHEAIFVLFSPHPQGQRVAQIIIKFDVAEETGGVLRHAKFHFDQAMFDDF